MRRSHLLRSIESRNPHARHEPDAPNYPMMKILDWLRNSEWMISLWDQFFGENGFLKNSVVFSIASGILAFLLGVIQSLPWMYVYLGFIAGLGFSLVIRNELKRGSDDLTPTSVGRADHPTSISTNAQEPFSLEFPYGVSSTPLHFSNDKYWSDKHGKINGEDLKLCVRAKQQVEDVRIRIAVLNRWAQETAKIEIELDDMPNGYEKEMCIASLHFVRKNATVPDGLGSKAIPIRQNVSAFCFEDTDAREELALGERHTFQIKIFSRDKDPQSAEFDWDLMDHHAPFARVRIKKGIQMKDAMAHALLGQFYA